jgi:hypothetical protein
LRSTILAQIAGDGVEGAEFDHADYLTYTPRLESGQTNLSQAQIQSLRQSDTSLNEIYTQAQAGGFVFGSALERSFSNGQSSTEIVMLRVIENDLHAFLIFRQAEGTVGIAIDSSSASIYKPGQGMRYELQSRTWHEINAVELAMTQSIGWKQCMLNCIEDKAPGEIMDAFIKGLSTVKKGIDCVKTAQGDDSAILGCSKVIEKAIPVYGLGVELGLCNVDCEKCEKAGNGCEDDNCHCCKTDKYRCNSNDWLYGRLGIDVIMWRQCKNGMYLAEVVQTICALCDKCVGGGRGPMCVLKSRMGTWINAYDFSLLNSARQDEVRPARAELSLVSSGSALECEECLLAKDPNEIVGPLGDLLPGQEVSYTIFYENVGQGVAFDVFVVNPLSEHFDLSTLKIHDEDGSGTASLSTATRTIFFQVGDLMPNGLPGAEGSVSYSIKLKSDLPSGTVIANDAVVHFPSVPEETPTNTAVNVIQPIAVASKQMQTTAGQALAIKLEGKDAAGAPLTYKIVDAPRYGTLTGTAPNLTYTPDSRFAGLDRLIFTASNGTMTSRQAEIGIQVMPDPNDNSRPTVKWTSPANGAAIAGSEPIFSNEETTLYSPYIQIQFSEAMKAETIVSNAFLVKDFTGRTIPVRMIYD